jgi:hypothetical protein
MEIIIALVLVVVGVFLFYNRKPKAVESTVEESVPYKVETPVVTEEVKAVEAPAKKTRTPRATKPAAKPAAKKAAAKKPAATKAKKPRAK